MLRYLFIIVGVVLLTWYFLTFWAGDRTEQDNLSSVQQAVCEVFPMDQCRPVSNEVFEPEPLEWAEPRDETCFLRLCW